MKALAFALLGCSLCGCSKSIDSAGEGSRDDAAVYEAVLKLGHCGPAAEGPTYLQIDGVDPRAELLARLRKTWPQLMPTSEMPAGKRHLVHISELRWIDDDTAEVNAGFNTGTDGRIDEYRLVRKAGQWTLDKTTNRAISLRSPRIHAPHP